MVVLMVNVDSFMSFRRPGAWQAKIDLSTSPLKFVKALWKKYIFDNTVL